MVLMKSGVVLTLLPSVGVFSHERLYGAILSHASWDANFPRDSCTFSSTCRPAKVTVS